jgi:hypothetical protein
MHRNCGESCGVLSTAIRTGILGARGQEFLHENDRHGAALGDSLNRAQRHILSSTIYFYFFRAESGFFSCPKVDIIIGLRMSIYMVYSLCEDTKTAVSRYFPYLS